MRLEALTRQQCIDLLELQVVGRLGVSLDGEQHVFPVNFRILGDTVLFRTDRGTKLDAAVGQRVVFEIDHVDRWNRRGWSVMVHGVAREISNDMDRHAVRIRSMTLHPWPPGPKAHWLVIDDPVFTGRRITWDEDFGSESA